MKISVIIPVLNEEKYIYSCLKSLEKNTCKANEIIVVDGGSNDKTCEIALEFDNVLVLKNEKKMLQLAET